MLDMLISEMESNTMHAPHVIAISSDTLIF